jgi:hypothetical protein
MGSGVVAAKINLGVWHHIVRALALKDRAADESHVKVGIIAQKGGKEIVEGGDISMIALMAIHEYGSPEANIPERAPMRKTFAEKKAEMHRVCAGLVKQFLAGQTMERCLNILGAWGAAQVKNTIREGVDPPNAPSTIEAKGSSTPLVDTGRLINAITWLVHLGFNRDARGRFTGGRFDK